MIWAWIILAVAITTLLLKGKKIELHNFVWALIPIDKYGITLLGFTFKPVYIFSLLVVAYYAIRKTYRFKISRQTIISTFLLLILVIVTSLLRNDSSISSDLKLYAMFFFTVICAVSVMSTIKSSDDLRQIKDVLIATAVGYGILFIILSGLDSIGITLPDVKSYQLHANTIIREFRNATNGVIVESQRLRGFYIDANASSVFLIVGFAALLSDIVKEGISVRKVIYSVIMTYTMLMTSSRTAVIIWIIITIISAFRFFFGKVKSRQKIAFVGVLLAGLFCATLVLIYNNNILDKFYELIASTYLNRSGLNDDAGRFTIWKSALASLTSKNWFYGAGTDGLYSVTNNYDAHSTFIQVLCTNGVIFGIVYLSYFIYPLIRVINSRFTSNKNIHYLSSLGIIYFSVIMNSSTVSHISSVYLIYIAFLLIAALDTPDDCTNGAQERSALRG